MSQKFEKLKNLLKELFQLDQPDLDFGLYRIMHAKSAEVTQFLDKDLLPQVAQAFSVYKSADKSELEKELATAIAQAQALGADPESLPKVKELRNRIANEAVDLSGLESEVYDSLYSFFRRYYSEGDFLAKRVYKPGVYAIPYEGEEVTLYWANRDQYYIKTSEYLRDYAFRLRPDDTQNPMRVHFRIVDAVEGQHGNVKAAEGKDRLFILTAAGESGRDFITEFEGEQGKELNIGFEYRPAIATDWPQDLRAAKTKPPSQKELISSAAKRIIGVSDGALAPWLAELSKPHVTSSGELADYTRLEAHIRRYAARNTFDYFIHKDLGTFLRQELDFYIKNEVMHLDDVESEAAPRVEQYLSKIKVIRSIAGKIINFLAQLEDFEKKLWLKKKFVVETQYCITIDKILEEFYPEIAGNSAQREEWVKLFAIDEIKPDLLTPGYSVPLTVEFLKANRALLIDTRFFPPAFTSRLLASITNIDAETDGVLFHGDNYHALSLMEARYGQQVKCIYIDPPYNTDVSAIPYKNDYRHSSWATMMRDRLDRLRGLMKEDGVIFVSIDKNERLSLEFALSDVFGANNKAEELIWVQNTNDSRAKTYSTNHEYVEVYAKSLPLVESLHDMFRETKPGFVEVTALIRELNPEFPSLNAIEEALGELYSKHKAEYRTEVETDGLDWEVEKRNDPWKGIYPYNRAEYRNTNGELVLPEQAEELRAAIWVWREDNISLMAAESKQSATIRDPSHPNYRFYAPPHPITGKPSLVPKGGWKYTYLDNPEYPERKSFDSLNRDHRIEWGISENKVPQLKRMLHEVETNVAKSVLVDYSDGEKQTAALFGRAGIFLAPKHTTFVKRFIYQVRSQEGIVLDCFGGSGSTAHAVIEANREDGGNRQYVTVEVSEYFDSILKPRILKAAYSHDWRDGKPVSRKGLSQFIKILRLESFEDSLANLETRRTDTQQLLLGTDEAQGERGFKEQFLMHYMLEVESRGSQSLLNFRDFGDPTGYKLKVKRRGSDESKAVNVDLLETFNWLVGLTVKHITPPQYFSAGFERDSEKRLRIKGRLKLDDAGPWWFRSEIGSLPDGRRTLIIWRKLTGNPEQDNLVLDEWFTKQGYSTRDFEFQVIYVNGDNNLENLKGIDDKWKVRLIEEDFHRLMFDVEGF